MNHSHAVEIVNREKELNHDHFSLALWEFNHVDHIWENRAMLDIVHYYVYEGTVQVKLKQFWHSRALPQNPMRAYLIS